ncbi:MAG: hypothetical protein GX442_04610 [Candidatus Riflebacteria bacterium]|nr:hypothetical protein [Candidatus Riflebacteria bacterium]
MPRAVGLLIAFLLGFWANLAQVATLRLYLGLFYGTEIHLGLFLGLWLAGVSAGGALAGWRPWTTRAVLAMMGLAPVAVLAVAVAGLLAMPAQSGTFLPTLPVVLFLAAVVLPLAIPVGMVLPAILRDSGAELGRAYGVEALGGFAGGALLSWGLGGTAPAALTLAVLPVVPLTAWLAGVRVGRLLPGLLAVVWAPLVAWGFPGLAQAWEARVWEHFHPGYRLADTLETPYQRIQVGEYQGQRSLYANGTFAAAWPDAARAEERAHAFMTVLPDPRRVLILGVPTPDLVAEFLKYRGVEVTVADLDTMVLRYLLGEQGGGSPGAESRPGLDPIPGHGATASGKSGWPAGGFPRTHPGSDLRGNGCSSPSAGLPSPSSAWSGGSGTLSSPTTLPAGGDSRESDRPGRLLPAPFVLREEDPRAFVRDHPGAFDGILVLPADPTTLVGNRLFTREAFAEMAAALATGGVLCVSVAGAENYLGPELETVILSTHRALVPSFAEVFAVPGEQISFWAARTPGVLATDPQVLGARLEARGIPTGSFLPLSFSNLLQPFRVDEVQGWLRRDVEVADNTDAHPRAFLRQLLLWDIFSGSQMSTAIRGAERLGMGVALPLLLGAALLLGLALWLSGPRRGRIGLLAAGVAVSGGGGLLAEIILLLMYQSRQGAMFQMVALFFGLYMLGLSTGAHLGRAWGFATPGRLRVLKVSQFGMVAACLALLRFPAWHTGPVIGAAVFLVAFLDGIEFPAVDAILKGWGMAPGRSAGLLIFSDNFGALWVGLASGIWLLPVLGMPGSLYLLAAALLLNVLGLLGFPLPLNRKGHFPGLGSEASLSHKGN